MGFSEKLGYLDKGGKWRKKDWWTDMEEQDINKLSEKEREERRRELEQIKREDEALMRQKLGLEPHKDVKVLL